MSVTDPTRIVVVASGFGLWRDGRHELSARWGDVVRVVAESGAASPTLVVSLRDGREQRLAGSLAGFLSFVNAAPAALGGAAAAESWEAGLTAVGSGASAAVTLYERRAPRQRSLQ